ncbi:hypothetical protein D3C76_854640 [compost metagenome]
MLAVCLPSTMAPARLAGSSGSPGSQSRDLAIRRSTNSSWIERSTNSRELAEQTSPWLKKMPKAAFSAARSRSRQSANTRFGLLPPHSSQTCLRLDCAAYCMKYLPTWVEPVNTSASTSMCRPRALPAVSPRPGTTFSTPSGMPASSASSASRRAENGDCSAGLSTTELPAASAGASFQAAMSSGKFHGTTAPITPSGVRVMVARAFCAVGATWS